MTFKYGQNNPSIKATLIGKITRKISHNEAQIPDFSNITSQNPHSVFNSILGLPLGVLGTFDILTAEDIVVSPVAIYFE